ncbi:MAG: hypothetical protein CK425_10850 [Parachlamydia sp.]|nr:MAG: hypothetical protein CK425_10850 [Parachlamydia sp.]
MCWQSDFTSTFIQKISRDQYAYQQYASLKLQQRDLETGSFITEQSLYKMETREKDLVCLNRNPPGCNISILDRLSEKSSQYISTSKVRYKVHLNGTQKLGVSFQGNESSIGILLMKKMLMLSKFLVMDPWEMIVLSKIGRIARRKSFRKIQSASKVSFWRL